MSGKRDNGDNAVSNKQIVALRKKMLDRLDVYNIFADLSPELEKKLAAAAEYSDFRRVENERQLEAIKSVLAGYILNEDVRVHGTVPERNGGVREVEMSRFDAMLKAGNLFLNAMNMQNKLWGLYEAPSLPAGAPGAVNIKNASIIAIQELQRIAKKEKLALPENESPATGNGSPNPDARAGVEG